jgi:hypothetical protein
MILLLTLINGVCWSFVYYEMILLGKREKTYCMPFLALGLNFTWEIIYTLEGIGDIQVQTFICIIRLILDTGIVYTYFKYGRERFPLRLQKKFIPVSIAVFIVCFSLQLAFYFQFDVHPAAQYSGFLQNAVMSLLFIYMFYTHSDIRGQSLPIAIVKCLGTLASAVQQGYIEMVNPYILICGAISLTSDICYIFLTLSVQGKKTA